MPGTRKPLRLTGPATNDIDAIWEFVAAESAESADRVVAGIERLIAEKIIPFPESYQLHPVLAPSGVRSARYRTWLVLFRVRTDEIQVLRVVHGGRDLTALRIADELP